MSSSKIFLIILAGLDRNRNTKSSLIRFQKPLIRIIRQFFVSFYRKHIKYDEINAIKLMEYRAPFDLSKLLAEEIDVNMMPIKLGLQYRDTIPDNLKFCIPLIAECEHFLTRYSLQGNVAYVTLQRSFVKAGTSQRRPGIHIDAPIIKCEGSPYFCNVNWGVEAFLGQMNGGIFVWTDQPETCGIYNLGVPDLADLVRDFDNVKEGGVDLEFLRDELDWTVRKMAPALKEKIPSAIEAHNQRMREISAEVGYPQRQITVNRKLEGELPWYKTIEPGMLYVMTDRAPHCSLPVKEDCYRTFFRLVVGHVGVRWDDDCTDNPAVPVPENVIRKRTKFN
jgi:hypothetical protein